MPDRSGAAGKRWRFVAKGASNPSNNNTAIAAAVGARVAALSAGIKIPLLQNQALRIVRYFSSLHQVADTATLGLLGGEFTVQVTPYGLINGVIGYPAITELSVNLTGAVSSAAMITATGTNFSLVDDWIEYDDTLINTAFSLIQGGVPPTPIQLQTGWECLNTTAVAQTIAVGEAATWEIWEATLY